MEADPKLLSLLEKINNPIHQINIVLTVEGVYGFPDEWKLTDDTNPNIFANVVKYQGQDLFGKIRPRDLTEKDKFDEYQKIVKKNKKEQKPPEEEEQMRRLVQLEEQAELERFRQMESMSDQEKLFMISEDKFKTISIQYDNPATFELTNIRELEEEIIEDRNFIYFYRQPAVSEEELVKLKKGKTKNLNNQELTQIGFKGNFDLKDLLNPGCTQSTVRCFLTQMENPDAPKYNCEKLYVKVTVETDIALTPLVEDVPPLTLEPKIIQKVPNKKQCVAAFKYDITLAMQALSEEYGKLFQSDQSKGGKTVQTTMTVQKKQELQKKKEQFLNEINSSGKYKILSDRLRTSIVRVCIDKFSKEGLYVGVNKDEQDRLYAELYVFMMEEMQKTLGTFIQNNKDEVHEDLTASYEQNLKERERVFQNVLKEPPLAKAQRLAKEYETINQIDQALKYYINMVLIDQKSAFTFARYCLKIQRFKAAEELIEMVRKVEQNKDFDLLMASLYIRRERFQEALFLVQQLLQNEPINTLYNLMISFIYKLHGNENLSDKYLRCTQRIYMRNMGLLSKASNKGQQDPHQLPNFKQQMLEQQEKAKKAPVLTQEQIDQIYTELIDYFTKIHLFDLAEKALIPIKDKTTPKMNIIRAQIHIFNENFPEAQSMIQKILNQNPKNYEVYIIKGVLCYQTEQFYEAEETFLKALSIQPKRSFDILLRLGYLYLKRKSWSDAKTIFEKALEAQQNSSLSWLGLGIANLRLNDPIAEECLCQANIYEPFNGEVWGYLALNCLLQKRGQQAKQCLKRMENTEVNDLELLQELGEELQKSKDFENARKIYLRVYNTQIITPTQGQLLVKLGKVHEELRKTNDALIFYQESLRFLEGDNEKAQVKEFIKKL